LSCLISSKLPEFVLEMCPMQTDTSASTMTCLSRLSLQTSDGVAVLDALGCRAILLKHIKNRLQTTCPCLAVPSSPDNLPMSGTSLTPDNLPMSGSALVSRQPAHVWQCPRLQTTCPCLAVPSKQERCRDSMPSSLWHHI